MIFTLKSTSLLLDMSLTKAIFPKIRRFSQNYANSKCFGFEFYFYIFPDRHTLKFV